MLQGALLRKLEDRGPVRDRGRCRMVKKNALDAGKEQGAANKEEVRQSKRKNKIKLKRDSTYPFITVFITGPDRGV